LSRLARKPQYPPHIGPRAGDNIAIIGYLFHCGGPRPGQASV
jgi:hypothetical protein